MSNVIFSLVFFFINLTQEYEFQRIDLKKKKLIQSDDIPTVLVQFQQIIQWLHNSVLKLIKAQIASLSLNKSAHTVHGLQRRASASRRVVTHGAKSKVSIKLK